MICLGTSYLSNYKFYIDGISAIPLVHESNRMISADDMHISTI